MSSTYFPHAVCTDCEWTQIFHAGSVAGAKHHAHIHHQDTGHTVRIKNHHEFADLVWTEEFTLKAYGDDAHGWWLESLPPFVLTLLNRYHAGLPLEQCEAEYTCTCGHCEEARSRALAPTPEPF